MECKYVYPTNDYHPCYLFAKNRFNNIYSVTPSIKNSHATYWLSEIWSTIVLKNETQEHFNQNNSCIAITQALLKILDLNELNWDIIKKKVTGNFSNNIIICDNMKDIHHLDMNKHGSEMTVINPMDSNGECIMVRCGYFYALIPEHKSNNIDIYTLMSAVIDFDVNMLVCKKNYLYTLEEDDCTLQMLDCVPFSAADIVSKYLQNHPKVKDIAQNYSGCVTLLLDSKRPLSEVELFGENISHIRNSKVQNLYTTGISTVMIPNFANTQIHNCFHMMYNKDYNVIAKAFELEYLNILSCQFDEIEMNQICEWLVFIRVKYRSFCPHEISYLVLTQDILDKFANVCKNCDIYFRMFLDDPRLPNYFKGGRLYSKNQIFNKNQINNGIILNPLTYCPQGPNVYIIELQAFFEGIRKYLETFNSDRKLRLKYNHFDKLNVEAIPFDTCLNALTDVHSLYFGTDFNDVLETELKYSNSDDNTHIVKSILIEQMSDETKKKMFKQK